MTTGLSAGREALRNVDVAIGAVGRPGRDDRRTHVIDVSDIRAFLGLDVGKGEHHATGIDRIREVRRSLAPWQNQQCVRDLDDRLDDWGTAVSALQR